MFTESIETDRFVLRVPQSADGPAVHDAVADVIEHLREAPHVLRRLEVVVRLAHLLGGLGQVALDPVVLREERAAQRVRGTGSGLGGRRGGGSLGSGRRLRHDGHGDEAHEQRENSKALHERTPSTGGIGRSTIDDGWFE